MEEHVFHVKKKTLLAIAGCVWLIAGANVTKLGLQAYRELKHLSFLQVFLSGLTWAAFSFLFYKMALKHNARIRSYEGQTRPFWQFFDLKAYLIMSFMMGGGMALRSSSLISPTFIAIFYTGLGLALSMAGIFFWRLYFKYVAWREDESSDCGRNK